MIKKILYCMLIGAILGVGLGITLDGIPDVFRQHKTHAMAKFLNTNPYTVKIYKTDTDISIIRIVSTETNEEYTIVQTERGNVLIPSNHQ